MSEKEKVCERERDDARANGSIRTLWGCFLARADCRVVTLKYIEEKKKKNRSENDGEGLRARL